MRLVPSFHLSYPDVRALRIALAAGAVAGLVVIAACSESGSQSLTAPTAISKATTFSGGFAYAQKILLCVNGQTTTWRAKYDSTGVHPSYGFSVLNNYPTTGGWQNHALNFVLGSPSGAYISGGTINANTCSEIYTASARAPVPDPNTDAFAAIDINVDTPAGATRVSTDCDIDEGLVNADGTPYTTHDGSPASPPNTDFYPICANANDVRVWGNFFHGSQVTVTFSTPQSTALIAPTNTTCQDYRDGNASTLGEIDDGFHSDQINSVSPGVFFYYAHITKGAGQSVSFNQTVAPNPAGLPKYAVQQGQAYLYNRACATVATLTLGTGSTSGSGGSALPAGNYILGIKFDPGSAKGTSVSAGLQTSGTLLATHNYVASIGGSSDPTTAASINTKAK
jgi:hypothetical protein